MFPQGQSNKSQWGKGPKSHSKGWLCCHHCHNRSQASHGRLQGPAMGAPTLLPIWVCAASGELLWLSEYRGTSKHSFAVVGGGEAQRASRCGLELQTSAHPPHKSVSGYCPQRLPAWVSLLCCRGRVGKVPEGLCFTCKLCHELQLILGN